MKIFDWFLKLSPLFLIAGLGYWVVISRNATGATETVSPMTEVWRVVKVTDGDTITVENTQGQKNKLRFCGIDSPEKSQPLGNDALKFLEKLVRESEYQVSVAEVERDRYGRIVAEIFTLLPDGSEKFLNEEMVKAGFAYHYKRYSGSCPNRGAIAVAEDIAKSKKVGVWGGEFEEPWVYRRRRKK